MTLIFSFFIFSPLSFSLFNSHQHISSSPHRMPPLSQIPSLGMQSRRHTCGGQAETLRASSTLILLLLILLFLWLTSLIRAFTKFCLFSTIQEQPHLSPKEAEVYANLIWVKSHAHLPSLPLPSQPVTSSYPLPSSSSSVSLSPSLIPVDT